MGSNRQNNAILETIGNSKRSITQTSKKLLPFLAVVLSISLLPFSVQANEFIVNTTIGSDQTRPQTAVLPNGSFVIT